MKNFSAWWCSCPEKQRQHCGWGWQSLCRGWLWVRPGSWAAQQAAWGGLLTLWASAASSSAKVCSVGFVAQREGAVCSRDTLVPWFESKEET